MLIRVYGCSFWDSKHNIKKILRAVVCFWKELHQSFTYDFWRWDWHRRWNKLCEWHHECGMRGNLNVIQYFNHANTLFTTSKYKMFSIRSRIFFTVILSMVNFLFSYSLSDHWTSQKMFYITHFRTGEEVRTLYLCCNTCIYPTWYSELLTPWDL